MERSEAVEQMPSLDGQDSDFSKDGPGFHDLKDGRDRSDWPYWEAWKQLNDFYWDKCVGGQHSMAPFATVLREISYIPKTVLEIGIRHMHSTVPLLMGKLDFLWDWWRTEEVDQVQKVYSCDIEQLPSHKWLQDLLPQLWEAAYKSSTDWFPPRNAGTLIVDGHHTYSQVSAELKHLTPFLAEGALVFFHDTTTFGSFGGGLPHQKTGKGKELGIRPAIDEWVVKQELSEGRLWCVEGVYAKEPGALLMHNRRHADDFADWRKDK